jgi:hypothetical protein
MWAIRKQHYITILLLTCLSLSGGCRQSKNERVRDQGISSGNDQIGFLHTDGDSVMFLQWTEINGKLNGQMNIFYSKGGRGKSTETSSHSFEGVSDGKNISLNFNGSQWTDPLGGKTWTGTISGTELTLVIPARSGTLAPVKFNAGTVEQYNQTVLGIKQSVEAENTKIQKENAEAARIEAEKGAVVEGNNRVRSSINALISSTNQLENSLRFDDVFRSYARTWEKMKADHKNLQDKASEKPLTSYKLGTVQYLLGGLQYDLGTFESHSGTLDYKIARVNDASKSVREAEKSVGDSWEFLQRAVVGNSSGSPTAQFSEADITQPFRAAEEKIQKALEQIQQASQRRASYDSQAKDLYRKADSFVKTLKPVE